MKRYENLRLLAEKAQPSFLQYYKKNKKRLAKMDTEVQEIHDEVSDEIDCLLCANCCRTLGPALYDKDIERMAKALRIKPAEVVSSYLRIDEDGDYVSEVCPVLFYFPIIIAPYMNPGLKPVGNILTPTEKSLNKFSN